MPITLRLIQKQSWVRISIFIVVYSLDKRIGGRRVTPVIGNEVWVGINTAIVDNITIGYDVLIAPNSYVNYDVCKSTSKSVKFL